MWQHIAAWFAWLAVILRRRRTGACPDCDGDDLCDECLWWWSIK